MLLTPTGVCQQAYAQANNSPTSSPAPDALGKHGFVDSDGVKLHYVSAGEGPLLIMLHGFPDYWYTWRQQIPALSKHYHVVALDQRGYNKSDKPEGVDAYAMDKLTADVKAVVEHFDQEYAIICGHDWGGAVAWNFAMKYPALTQRLIILNLPHPWGLQRELVQNPQQARNSQYARNFQKDGAEQQLTAAGLAAWVTDPTARGHYVKAFERSSFTAMLNYYRANYPRPPYRLPASDPPPVRCSVLMIHGLDDQALLPGGLNDTWKWLRADLTLVTVPGADHFVQQAKADFVTRAMLSWLQR